MDKTLLHSAIDAERIEDGILDLQQEKIVMTWTMLEGIALYLSNLADKRSDDPRAEAALNLAAAHTIAAANAL